MEDLYRYLEDGYTCTILQRGAPVYQSRERGVRPLLALIDAGADVHGCTAVDSIVGRAAALLYVYLGIAVVTADVMSVGAREVLTAHGNSKPPHGRSRTISSTAAATGFARWRSLLPASPIPPKRYRGDPKDGRRAPPPLHRKM